MCDETKDKYPLSTSISMMLLQYFSHYPIHSRTTTTARKGGSGELSGVGDGVTMTRTSVVSTEISIWGPQISSAVSRIN